MDPSGECLENYRYVDWRRKLNTSTTASYVTQLSDTLVIQLNIFRYIDGVGEQFIPCSSIDVKISLWGHRMVLSGVIYHEGEQSHCVHDTS